MNELDTQMKYALTVEANTNLDSLIDIDNASKFTQLVRSDKDRVVGFWGWLGSATTKESKSLSDSIGEFITHEKTHDWNTNTTKAKELNGGMLGPGK
jgi:hypothetical protein